jgi:hypothetical protein
MINNAISDYKIMDNLGKARLLWTCNIENMGKF